MSGKHDCECGCVECIAYMETNLQVDLDEWSYDVDFPGTVPSIRYSVGTATNSLTADTDRRLVDKNAVVLNPHSFGSVNPPDIRKNVSETQRERIHETTRKEYSAEQQRKRRALKEAVPHISSFFIGRRIRKLRIGNDFSRKWYTGIITAWDPDDKMYHVKYDDNDSEDLDHKEMFECINTFEKYWQQQQKRNVQQRERRRKNAEVP
jgi:hypothetical protein